MFHFVANLKPYTFHRGRGNKRFDIYLQSIDYQRGHNALIKKLHTEQKVLAADNGNVDLIGEFIDLFAVEAKPLEIFRKQEEKMLGRYIRPGELSEPVKNLMQELATQIHTKAAEFTNDPGFIQSVVMQQEKMKGSYFVGMEDFTLVTMTALGLEREYVQLPDQFYTSAQQRAINYAINTKAGIYGATDANIFAGLHAMDFDSAFEGGKLAAEAGLEGIASGLVAALKDRSFIDYYIYKGELRELPNKVPRSYFRTVEIIAGFIEGYAQVAGKRPSFHALGLGSPILLVLVAALSNKDSFIVADSTAPIIEAITTPTLILYVDEPAPIKLKTYKIAQHWITHGFAWRCQCPYCRKFNQQYPPDLKAAQNWWKNQGQPKIKREHLFSTGGLSEHFPLLGYSSDPIIREQAGLARTMHNHWILQRLEKQVCRVSDDEAKLIEWAQSRIDDYMNSYAHPSWKRGVEYAWNLVRQTLQVLRREN